MRTQLTIASLATISQAIQLRQQDTTTHPDTDGTHYDDDRYSFHNWVGKYHFQGASDDFLECMYDKDLDKDGKVTVRELTEVILMSTPNIDATEVMAHMDRFIEEHGEDYNWEDDEEFMAYVMPYAFDANNDGMLGRQEASNLYDFLGVGEMAEEFFDANAYLPHDMVANTILTMRYQGDQSGSQVENMTDVMHYIYAMDKNGDDIVTVREFLEAFILAVGHQYDHDLNEAGAITEGGVTFHIDDMINKCGGEACDWIHNDEILADVISSGVDLHDYESLYTRFDALSMPWITDTAFELGAEHIPATHEQFMGVVQRLKYDPGFTVRPEDWIPREERLVPDIGEEPTREQVVEYAKEEMMTVQEMFQEITVSDMTAADFNIDHEDIRKYRELLQLLERFVR